MSIIKLIAITAALLLIAMAAMAIRIIFHKSHKFTETSTGHNKELKKKGITCPRHDEIKKWGKTKNESCATCYEHARN